MATPQQKKKPAPATKPAATSTKQTAKEKAVAAAAVVDPSQDIEARRTRLKALILLGKERGYLTFRRNQRPSAGHARSRAGRRRREYINDMGITVCDVAPDTESLVMNETAPPVADEDAAEEAEAAISTVDSEFGRTTDPVRMYMREMGVVNLLTRQDEIEIAKRIEDGLST